MIRETHLALGHSHFIASGNTLVLSEIIRSYCGCTSHVFLYPDSDT